MNPISNVKVKWWNIIAPEKHKSDYVNKLWIRICVSWTIHICCLYIVSGTWRFRYNLSFVCTSVCQAKCSIKPTNLPFLSWIRVTFTVSMKIHLRQVFVDSVTLKGSGCVTQKNHTAHCLVVCPLTSCCSYLSFHKSLLLIGYMPWEVRSDTRFSGLFFGVGAVTRNQNQNLALAGRCCATELWPQPVDGFFSD